MPLKRIAVAAAAAGALLAAMPAQAGSLGFGLSIQSGGPWYEPWHGPRDAPYPPPGYGEPYYAPALLSPRQIERLLRRSGYSRLEVVALRGPVYTVQGVDPWHNVVEMQVLGHDGRILRSDPIAAPLYATPFATPPPVALPDQGPRIVGAVPQAPRGVTRRTEPQLVTAPLPRARPDYRPQPETAQRAEPDAAIPEPEERPGGRDPLVVY